LIPKVTAMGLLADKLTTSELAIELKRSPETVKRWRRLRLGPPWIALPGGRVLYDRAEVERWLEEQRPGHSRPQAA
jgi:hypothetical protein